MSAEVEGRLVRALDRAVRAVRMYPPGRTPVVRALAELQSAIAAALEQLPAIEFGLEPGGVFFAGLERFPQDAGPGSLGDRLYRDGVRALVFERGAERETEVLVGALSPPASAAETDLVARLWNAGFTRIRVRVLAPGGDTETLENATGEGDGSGAGGAGGAGFPPIDLPEREWADPQLGAGTVASRPSQTSLSKQDFEATTYFLDADELDALQREADEEWTRTLCPEVEAALLDRLEDGDAARQQEVLEILEELLLLDLAQGALGDGARVLDGVVGAMEGGQLDDAARERAEHLVEQLATPEVLEPLLDRLAGAEGPDIEAGAALLRRLPPAAAAALFSAAGRASSADAAERLRQAAAALVGADDNMLSGLLADPSSEVVIAAAGVAALRRLAGSVPALVALLDRDAAAVRRAAAQALATLGGVKALESLALRLDDDDAGVRLEALRGIAAAHGWTTPVREATRRAARSRALHNRAAAEQSLLLEAWLRMDADAAVRRLVRMLARRRWPFRSARASVRAAAALALNTLPATSPAVSAALAAAAGDSDPIVRTAARRTQPAPRTARRA